MYQIRQAKNEDSLTILSLIETAKKKMALEGIDQWQNGSPNLDMILEDIFRGESCVLEYEGDIVASAMISFNGEMTYNEIVGKWTQEGSYAVIHRFVVSQDFSDKGIGKVFMKSIEEKIKMKMIRIDTHKDNLRMRKMLESLNYNFCGIITLKDGSKRLAYDKIVTE